MKIRHGFVSNSSSSSFILYGAKIDYNSDVSEIFQSSPYNFRVQSNDDDMFVGKTLMYGVEDNDPTKLAIPHTEIQEKMKLEITAVCQAHDIAISDNDFGVYAGTVYN